MQFFFIQHKTDFVWTAVEWENKMHSFNLSAAVLEHCVTQVAAEDRSATVKDVYLVHVCIYSIEKYGKASHGNTKIYTVWMAQ